MHKGDTINRLKWKTINWN